MLSETKDINVLSKYYYHADDSIHNLYLLFIDILTLIEELYENKVYYTDIHRGNFVVNDNSVKLIDFDYKYIHFEDKKDKTLLRNIFHNYDILFFIINKRFNLGEIPPYNTLNFNDAKKYIAKKYDDEYVALFKSSYLERLYIGFSGKGTTYFYCQD